MAKIVFNDRFRSPENAHAASVEALQRWLWNCAAAGWTLTGDAPGTWSHDDNMAVQHLGWMIAKPPGSPLYDLFSLTRASPAACMKVLLSAAATDPYCAKAVVLLTQQRLLHPTVKFAYLEVK